MTSSTDSTIAGIPFADKKIIAVPLFIDIDELLSKAYIDYIKEQLRYNAERYKARRNQRWNHTLIEGARK